MPPTYDDEDLVNASQKDVIAMAKLRQKLSDDFWDLWQRHYLQERAIHWEWRHRATPIRVGEVVLVREDNVKRMEWMMGLIVEVFPSASDGIVRSVNVKTASGVLRRPVQRLCALEVQAAGVPDVLPAAPLSDEESSEEDPDPAEPSTDRDAAERDEEAEVEEPTPLPVSRPRGRPRKIDSARQETSAQGGSVGDSEDVRVSSRGRRLLKKKMFDI